ncbi:hypothetical protein IC235_17420 [Hymenobacter sp. BT664]|uniref:AAA family ATPase n=1 Tax=Hymenobacter montanus TaxID=2771359 RepID=A0A927GKK1_9BACT|nr:hypothetical protein [Hymenobacter montanus]MBD2769673.1 hypothetical protein [Hymenobacter montanus]
MTEEITQQPGPAEAGPTVAGLLAHAHELLSAPPEPSAGLARLLALSRQVRAATEQPVTFRPALFWQDDEPVIWPRTVNLIQGQTGVHKSRVAELFGSAALTALASRATSDTLLGLGFRPAEGEAYRLLYIDTERNTSDQLPYAIQQLKARAGYGFAEHPPMLDYTSLVMEARAERFPRLAEFLAHQRRGFDGHLLVILDVLSDCVADYNDVGASLGLIDLLNVAVNEQDATFIAVIHENPGSTSKARGHLGTEASNKASTVLQVGFVKEGGRLTPLIQLLYLKRRYAAPGLTFFATFDEFTRGLVRADVDATDVQQVCSRPGPQRKASAATVLSLLPTMLADGPLPAGELVAGLAEELSVSPRTVKTYLSELLPPYSGYVNDLTGRRCCLVRRKAGAGFSLLYSLEPSS